MGGYVLYDLGVALEYIDFIEYEIEDGHTSRDGYVYEYLVHLRSDTHEHIIRELDGVTDDGHGYYVTLDPSYFDEEPYDDEY